LVGIMIVILKSMLGLPWLVGSLNHVNKMAGKFPAMDRFSMCRRKGLRICLSTCCVLDLYLS
jgi:hypothetical protein